MKLKSVLKLMDLKTLIAGIVPVIIGSIYSLYRYDSFHIIYFIVLLIAMILIQSSANMINDYYDFKRGSDTINKAHEKVLASGELTLKQVKRLIGVYLGIDLIVAAYFAVTMHYMILVVTMFAASVIYFYSAGKRPISHSPFGEFVAGTTMGFGILTTVIYIQSGMFNLETTIVALPTAIYIGAILLTNNISDHNEDRLVGRRTLPIHIGIHWAEVLWTISCHSLLTFTAVFVFVGYYPLAVLMTVLVMFPFRPIYRFKAIPKEAANKEQLMGLIGKIGLRYHLGILLGLLIAIIF